MTPIDAITAYLRDDLLLGGNGALYTSHELADAASYKGVTLKDEDVAHAILAGGGITIPYRNGHASTRITFERPNRSSQLQQVGPQEFSFDTEAAIQNGLAQWFRRQDWTVRREVSDGDETVASIVRSRSLEHLPERPTSASTRCRDLMAHSVESPQTTFHIIEVKGRTQLESDVYDTFGQVFPIADANVTRGWTNNKVPKHGNCLKYARQFIQSWSDAFVTLVVVVPDFPPADEGPSRFFDGPTRYYPRQAAMFSGLVGGDEGLPDHTFARLLHHLRDGYGLLQMVRARRGIAFRLWGYQGVNWIRDFATNSPVRLQS